MQDGQSIDNVAVRYEMMPLFKHTGMKKYYVHITLHTVQLLMIVL